MSMVGSDSNQGRGGQGGRGSRTAAYGFSQDARYSSNDESVSRVGRLPKRVYTAGANFRRQPANAARTWRQGRSMSPGAVHEPYQSCSGSQSPRYGTAQGFVARDGDPDSGPPEGWQDAQGVNNGDGSLGPGLEEPRRSGGVLEGQPTAAGGTTGGPGVHASVGGGSRGAPNRPQRAPMGLGGMRGGMPPLVLGGGFGGVPPCREEYLWPQLQLRNGQP